MFYPIHKVTGAVIKYFIPGNGLIDENDFMQWVTKIQAIQGLDVSASGGDSEEEITRDLLAAFK